MQCCGGFKFEPKKECPEKRDTQNYQLSLFPHSAQNFAVELAILAPH